MENVMAIDVGTGYAKAAIFYAGMKEPMILIPDNMPMGMRSIAYLCSDGKIQAGSRATGTAIRNIKISLSRETISESVGNKTYDIEPGKVYGEIAKALIILANETLVKKGKQPVYSVVATYPAAFVHSDNPRATIKSVQIMKESIESLIIDGNKIKVVKMLPEPVAAAYESICYERNVKENPITDKSYNIAVFDIGHGTFDVAVVTSTNEKDEPFDVIAQGGDKEVGGRIFDKKIFERFCKTLGHPDELTLNARELEELHFTTAVNIKHGLSNSEKFFENIFSESKGEFVEVGMTRSEFESLIETDLNKTLIATVNAIELAGQKGVKINEIILTGGSSKIIAVEQMLKNAFTSQGINVRSFRPEHAVVFGAARYAFNLEAAPLKQHAEYSYGIFMDETSKVKFLIDSDDELPKKSSAFNITPGFCSTSIRVCRSKNTHCTKKELDYDSCKDLWRYRFDTYANKPHKFVINLDETHKLTVECEYPDGKKITKTKYDD